MSSVTQSFACGLFDGDVQGSRLGKAVYRELGEGRWVITVTANGSLDLVSAPEGESFELVSAPPVRDYEQIQQEAAHEIDAIGPGDVVRRVFFGKPQPEQQTGE